MSDSTRAKAAALLAETNRLYPDSPHDLFPGTERLIAYMRDVRALCETLQEEA